LCLCADLTAAEAHHLLVLLHEWDLAGTGRHSLTDMYICLQLLALVRVPAGALSGQGNAPTTGLALQERPDSRQSNATTSSLTNSTSAAGRLSTGGPAAGQLQAGGAASAQQKRSGGKKGVTTGAAWEGAAGAGGGSGSKAGLSLKEAYLKERVAALEAELTHARSPGTGGHVHSKEVRQHALWEKRACRLAGLSFWRGVHKSAALCCEVLDTAAPAASTIPYMSVSVQVVFVELKSAAVVVSCRLTCCVLRWPATRPDWQSWRTTS
jgi:hypothetical protein